MYRYRYRYRYIYIYIYISIFVTRVSPGVKRTFLLYLYFCCVLRVKASSRKQPSKGKTLMMDTTRRGKYVSRKQ